MTEPVESGAVDGAVEPVEESGPETSEKRETSLEETFDSALDISQDVQDVEAAKTPDGATEKSPAPATSTTEPKWEVGARCRAVWSEDGQRYPATVLCVDGQRCRVRFDRYGNEEDVELSALQRPTTPTTPPLLPLPAPTTPQRRSAQDWSPGARCRAVYSEDGLVYPAVVLWVKGQRCRVRFDNYNNEEELDVGGLLHTDELLGAGRAKVKERPIKEREEPRRGHLQRDEAAEKPTNHSFSLFPPFPPPPQSSSGDPLSFITAPPPPPPLWMFGGKESDSASSMLMLWYMCGFHTGSFMAQQLSRPSTTKD